MKANKTNEKILTRLQQNLFEAMYSRAHRAYLAHHNRALKNYEKQFFLSLPQKPRSSSWQTLLKEVQGTKLILFGDFHTLEASQDVFLNTLKASKTPEPILALEAFRAKDQKYLDLFMTGKINEGQFQKKIQYQKSWGFPWGGYQRILNYAKEANLRVLGINQPGRTPGERDRKIARELNKIIKTHPNRQVFGLIGELHLAREHLPRLLPTPLIVLNNLEHHLFRASFFKVVLSSGVFQLGRNTFCVFNTPPWKKWFSYLAWEKDFDLDLEFHSLTKHLSEALGGSAGVDLDNFNLYLPEEIYEKTHKLTQLTEFFGHYVHNNRIFLKEFSLDHLLKSCGEFLYLQRVPQEISPNKTLETFFNHQLLKTTFGCLSLSLLDPFTTGWEPTQPLPRSKEPIHLCKTLGQNWGQALFREALSSQSLRLDQLPQIFFTEEKSPEDVAKKIEQIALKLITP